MIAPIATRELLVASRSPFSWRVRIGITSIALLVCFIGLGTGSSSAGLGTFQFLTFISLLYALGTGLVFTTDCICEERREGTFGLLYLTPLSSWDVIAGKLAGTSLQGIFGLIAVLPVLFVPLLAGGVTGQELGRVVLVLVGTLFLSLSAGMFASAAARSRRGAFGMATFLILAPLIGGWVGVMLCTVLAYISEQGKKKRADVFWYTAYWILVAFFMAMVALSGLGLIGSPGLAYWAASSTVTDAQFMASFAGVAATAVFYLFSAALCTEWYREARDIVVTKADDSEHIDDLFFPGLRSKGRVYNDPAIWLMNFLQSPPFLFYVSLAFLLLVNLGYGRAPGSITMHPGLFMLILVPYLIFNYTLARYCAAPFAMLERSGFLETVLSTPLRVTDLARAQRRIFWLTLRLPFIFLMIGAVPAGIAYLSSGVSRSEIFFGAVIFYAINWFITWIVFALHLETLAHVAMFQGIQGRKPMNAAFRACTWVLLPPIVVNIAFVMFWSVLVGGRTMAFVPLQLVAQGVVVWIYFVILKKTKAKIGLRPHLFEP